MSTSPIGYGPAMGYSFLKKSVVHSFYSRLNIRDDEICITEGIKGQLSLFMQLLPQKSVVAIENPAYPLYNDLAMHYGMEVYSMPLTEEANFQPQPPSTKVSVIILCSPHNPTGAVYSHETLQKFVSYAKKNHALILFDAAYAAFHREGAPRSIYEIPGADAVAIELGSFSKGHGFTGLRMGYTVIPKKVLWQGRPLLEKWNHLQNLFSNGYAYPIQKAAVKALDTQQEQLSLQNHYLSYAKHIKNLLISQGHQVTGGDNNPYLWWKTETTGLEFWDYLFNSKKIVGVPGEAFGSMGKHYIRLSCFINETTFQQTQHALGTLCIKK